MLNGKRILITGGTGSFGKKFVEIVTKKYPDIARLVIYSRDELKQYEMAQLYPKAKYPNIRFFIGDVRDGARLKRACEGIDIVIHAAAMKHVPIAEYNPMECIYTNVFGAENIVNAALDGSIKCVVALSTDKAAAPVNLYGATKLCSDKLFIAANNLKGSRDLRLSVVRYGNVFGSRGSVVPFFLDKKKDGVLPITHEGMTRFSITLEDGVNLVLRAIDQSFGGEIFVPKIPSYRILDLARAIAPECRTEVVGIRPGEKLHEEMITESDAMNTYDCGDQYIIKPMTHSWDFEKWRKAFNAKPVAHDFKYNSGTNTEWLTTGQIQELTRSEINTGSES